MNRLFLIGLTLLIASCTRGPSDSKHPIDAEGFSGRTPLRAFMDRFPSLANEDAVFCRGLDPDLDPSEVILLNPLYKDSLVNLDVKITKSGEFESANVVVSGKEQFASLSREHGPYTSYPVASYPMLGSGWERGWVMMNTSATIDQNFLFGVVSFVHPEGNLFLARNALCKLSGSYLALMKQTTAIPNFTYPESAVPPNVARDASVLNGTWLSDCRLDSGAFDPFAAWTQEDITISDGEIVSRARHFGKADCQGEPAHTQIYRVTKSNFGGPSNDPNAYFMKFRVSAHEMMSSWLGSVTLNVMNAFGRRDWGTDASVVVDVTDSSHKFPYGLPRDTHVYSHARLENGNLVLTSELGFWPTGTTSNTVIYHR